MDLSHLNARAAAERALEMPLCDPNTREPLEDGDSEPRLLIRGLASKKSQDRLSEILKGKKTHRKDEENLSLSERVHKSLCETAIAYIEGAIDIEIDGKPVEKEADIKKLLDMTYPVMERKKDDEGNNVTIDGVPQYEIGNWPWAQQVIDFAEEQKRFFDGSPTS